MSEFHDLLDRKAQGFRPAEDGLDRTIDRADRRHKNHRVTSAVVALIVAVVGGVGVYQMLGNGGNARTGSGGVGDFYAIWPQTTEQDARTAQARADRGDAGLTWQTNDKAVIENFTNEQLEWSIEGADPTPGEITGDGPVTVTVTGTPYVDCTDPSTNTDPDVTWSCPPGHTKTALVTIARMIRSGPGGIWHVTQATVDGQSVQVGPSPLPAEATPEPDGNGAVEPQPTAFATTGTEGDEAYPPPPGEVSEFVNAFMSSRAAQTTLAADRMSQEAKTAYETHEGGLDLYAYMQGSGIEWSIAGWRNVPDTDRWEVIVEIRGNTDAFPDDGIIHETLRVGSPGDGAPYVILEAQRNE